MRNVQITDYSQMSGETTKIGASANGIAYPTHETTTPTVNDWLPSFLPFLPGVRLPFQVLAAAATNTQLQEAAKAVNTARAPMFGHQVGAQVARVQEQGRRYASSVMQQLRNPQW